MTTSIRDNYSTVSWKSSVFCNNYERIIITAVSSISLFCLLGHNQGHHIIELSHTRVKVSLNYHRNFPTGKFLIMHFFLF